MNRRNFALAAVAVLMMANALHAQDETPGKPVQFGGFDNHGEATVGYRFTDVRGYAPQYRQMFNLRSGFRVEDLSFFGDAHGNTGTFADRYSFTASGLGGDPFPAAQLKVSKFGLYEFRANWRQSYYNWNQNDNVVLPIHAVAPALTTGLTNNHDWATVRKFGSADLTLHATRNLQFTLEIGHTSNDGTLFTTRTLDFFSAPSYWAAFARANPYYLAAPLQDSTERVAGGIDYTRKDWSFHYKTGYQTFNENMTLSGLVPNETSIDPVALSLTEPLSKISWSQSRRLTTPISEFSFTGKLFSKLQWRGGYIYYRYRGPAAMDQSANGIGPDGITTNGVTSYSISQSGRARVTEPSHTITQGFTFEIRKWWDVDVDYRYMRDTSESVSNLASVFNGTTLAPGSDDIVWRNGLSDLSVGMNFRPMRSLTIHPGIRLLKSDMESLENGIADASRTLRTKTARPEIGFSYKPRSTFSVRGDLRSSTSGASYTAITPHTRVGGRVIVRYQPLANLSVENSMNVSNSALLAANFKTRVRSNSTTVSYAWSDRLSTFAGVTYDSYFAEGDIIYPRTTAKFSLRNQEINRVGQVGFEFKPTTRTGMRLSGNYERTTGEGQITGEPPAYGPVKYPLATGTFYFNFPRAGRLSLDLQRTYYIEQLVPVNNFSASLLTIRWTRGF